MIRYSPAKKTGNHFFLSISRLLATSCCIICAGESVSCLYLCPVLSFVSPFQLRLGRVEHGRLSHECCSPLIPDPPGIPFPNLSPFTSHAACCICVRASVCVRVQCACVARVLHMLPVHPPPAPRHIYAYLPASRSSLPAHAHTAAACKHKYIELLFARGIFTLINQSISRC